MSQELPTPGAPVGMESPCDNVFIADLPTTMDENQLQAVFGAYGVIKNCRMLGPSGKNGKPAALVQFGSLMEAMWIVENLNGNIPQGLGEPIIVRYKTDKYGFAVTKGSGKGGPYGPEGMVEGKGKGKDKGKKGCSIRTLVDGLHGSGHLPGTRRGDGPFAPALFVGGLPTDCTDLDLFRIFACFGAIGAKGVKAIMTDDYTACRGYGFINYLEPGCAQNAITTLNGTQMPDGTTLRVSYKRGGDGFVPQVPNSAANPAGY
eukprot:TRINITY_DN8458_c0_g1_i3.p1 TRINITY_DN8458_c0_g1~~TRINITY_DN8458_c0_g1_i3.p1  ORF type:complete len:261 (-),score=42.75 TRINITY_DN8458_c0_g1_i3:136-918(-)